MSQQYFGANLLTCFTCSLNLQLNWKVSKVCLFTRFADWTASPIRGTQAASCKKRKDQSLTCSLGCIVIVLLSRLKTSLYVSCHPCITNICRHIKTYFLKPAAKKHVLVAVITASFWHNLLSLSTNGAVPKRRTRVMDVSKYHRQDCMGVIDAMTTTTKWCHTSSKLFQKQATRPIDRRKPRSKIYYQDFGEHLRQSEKMSSRRARRKLSWN